jgi:CheY-like chemotaxis protein/uncharacterized protein YbcI
MPTAKLRVLVVDDNRDGADALGLLAEELGHQVHVTYGGITALDIARTFQPHLMLIDLAMPDMDGCSLVTLIRNAPAFAHTKLVAITGHADQGHKSLAIRSGFEMVLFKPVALTEFKAVLNSVPVLPEDQPGRSAQLASLAAQRFLPIDEARRIRNERQSKTLTEAESQGAICGCFIRFQADYLGWRSEEIQVHFINDLLLIRILGSLTLAECQLAKASTPAKGRDLIKEVRKQLLEVARPMLESMVHEVAGVKALSMHHDISTVTGEEVVLFPLAEMPRFASDPARRRRRDEYRTDNELSPVIGST